MKDAIFGDLTPTKRVRLPRTEEPRWREYGLFQAYTVGWKSRNEAKRKKITSALERPGSARGLPMWRARARERRARALRAPAPWVRLRPGAARPRPGCALVARPRYSDCGKFRFLGPFGLAAGPVNLGHLNMN